MSRRTEQLASILHQAVQSVLQEGLADPRAAGMATVTGVRVTDDLSQAVISVSILPEKNESLYMHALEDASNFIRRRASDLISLHRPPRFLFRLDRSLKKQAAVFQALSEIASERNPAANPPDSPAEPSREQSPGAGPDSRESSSKEATP